MGSGYPCAGLLAGWGGVDQGLQRGRGRAMNWWRFLCLVCLVMAAGTLPATTVAAPTQARESAMPAPSDRGDAPWPGPASSPEPGRDAVPPAQDTLVISAQMFDVWDASLSRAAAGASGVSLLLPLVPAAWTDASEDPLAARCSRPAPADADQPSTAAAAWLVCRYAHAPPLEH